MSTILITGATGQVGSELVKQLASSGHTLRALIRDPQNAHLPKNIQKVVGDLGDPQTLPPALKGVEKIYLMDRGMDQNFTNNMVVAAKAAGVKLIVDLSSIGAGLDPMPVMAKWHYDREQAIRASGIAWTFLRPNSFMSNCLWWAPGIKSEGVVRDPIGPGKISLVDPADIAAVAATALTHEGHTGKIYNLTGPQSLTTKEQVAILADVLGRAITYVEITPQEAAKARSAMGMDPTFVEASKDRDIALRAGEGAILTDDFEQVTGHKPATFESWCLRHAGAFS
ncbi:MAG TPA: SDR family oxidoreductase [Nevskiaceae bacterium]|nr:SDR family oxidoreductase [Nevskiaceae bacterium]